MYAYLLFYFLYFLPSIYSITCKNENGDDTSSWTIFKLPASTSYLYYQKNTTFHVSSYSLNDTKYGALTHTMDQLWKDSPQYILYNDEQPFQENYNFTVGHTKAVIMWNNNGGIIIQHSIPKFPYGPKLVDVYSGIPSNAYTYGQHITCFPLSLGDLKMLSYSLPLSIPNIYDSSCVGSECLGNFANVIAGEYNTSAICTQWELHNLYMMFQKTTQWGKDLWADCVGIYYRNNLQVESWIHGNAIGPTCWPFNTVDISTLDFLGHAFSEYNDHSKWAIGDSPLVCFGDINRMTTQYTRGGGSFCWSDRDLWNILSKGITSANQC